MKRKKIIPVHSKLLETDKTIEAKAKLFEYRKYPQVESRRS